jgi:transposase-like protein
MPKESETHTKEASPAKNIEATRQEIHLSDTTESINSTRLDLNVNSNVISNKNNTTPDNIEDEVSDKMIEDYIKPIVKEFFDDPAHNPNSKDLDIDEKFTIIIKPISSERIMKFVRKKGVMDGIVYTDTESLEVIIKGDAAITLNNKLFGEEVSSSLTIFGFEPGKSGHNKDSELYTLSSVQQKDPEVEKISTKKRPLESVESPSIKKLKDKIAEVRALKENIDQKKQKRIKHTAVYEEANKLLCTELANLTQCEVMQNYLITNPSISTVIKKCKEYLETINDRKNESKDLKTVHDRLKEDNANLKNALSDIKTYMQKLEEDLGQDSSDSKVEVVEELVSNKLQPKR